MNVDNAIVVACFNSSGNNREYRVTLIPETSSFFNMKVKSIPDSQILFWLNQASSCHNIDEANALAEDLLDEARNILKFPVGHGICFMDFGKNFPEKKVPCILELL